MKLPFTTNEFLELFGQYNVAVWPAQILLTAMALGIVGLLFRPSPYRTRLVFGGLSLFWAWMAVAYHFLFFTRINPAARLFGAVFLVASVIFAFRAISHRMAQPGSRYSFLGGLMIIYALAVYPLINWMTGHHYPAIPTFGLPCPTTIFTLGALLLIKPLPPGRVFVLPLVWTAVGTVAAFQLGVYADLGLLFAGLATVIVLFRERTAGYHAPTIHLENHAPKSRNQSMAAANRIVILYATRQGQTAKIAAYIADALRKRGFDVDLFNLAMLSADFNLGRYSAAILASSVNYGRHQPELMDYVKEHGGELQDMNTVFLSVSGAQAGAEDVAVSESARRSSAARARTAIENFTKQTGWRPDQTMPVGGAMMYLEYNWFFRFMIRLMARLSGSKIDTTRNTEYTNWVAIDEFCRQFAEELNAARHIAA